MFAGIEERLTNIGNLINQLGDIISTISSILLSVFKFLVDLIQFLIFAFKTIVNYIVKGFDGIFGTSLFNSINSTFSYISHYIGTGWTTILISLFVLSFFMILVGFIFRLLKGQINNKNTLASWKRHFK